MMSGLHLSGSEELFLLGVSGISCEGLGFGCCSKEGKWDVIQAEIQWMEGTGHSKGALQLGKAGNRVETLSGKDTPFVCYQLNCNLLKLYLLWNYICLLHNDSCVQSSLPSLQPPSSQLTCAERLFRTNLFGDDAES